MVLSPIAFEALRQIRCPATRVDLPGVWPVVVFLRVFGQAILDELLRAGLVRCGGMPDAVPITVNRTHGDVVRKHWGVVQFNAALGTPLYPVQSRVLMVTHAGWRQKSLAVQRVDRRVRWRSSACSAGRGLPSRMVSDAPEGGDGA